MRINLAIPVVPSELLSGANIEVLLPTRNESSFMGQDCSKSRYTLESHRLIEIVTTDSRDATSGELFISLAKGGDARKRHIKEALSHGAYAIDNGVLDEFGLSPLERLAGYCKSRMKCLKHTVAITGSVGKTTTKEFVRHILNSEYKTYATQENMNNEVGLPLTILSAPYETEVLILELGMNARGEIGRLSRTASPDIALITNIGSSHIGMLGSSGAIREAKLEISEGLTRNGVLITRLNDKLSPPINKNTTHFTYGYRDMDADYPVFPLDDGKYSLKFDGEGGSFEFFDASQDVLENLSAAISVAFACGMSVEAISSAISTMDCSLLRYKTVKIGNLTIIDDAYNASLESISAALLRLSVYETGLRSILLGDILELGEYSDSIHYEVGQRVCGNADKLYLVGEKAGVIKQGAIAGGFPEDRIFSLTNADNISDIASGVRSLAEPGECILVKASHGVGLHKFAYELRRMMSDED